MGEGAGLGFGAAMMSVASWVAGRASSSGRPGPSREQLAKRQLEHTADSGDDEPAELKALDRKDKQR